jgi:hypothetical protein
MARIHAGAAVVAAALAFTAPPVGAQALTGTGQHATPLFRLEAGLAVFELEHRGRDRFVVLLLDDRAQVVARLADAPGAFTGSKAVRVPRSGSYLLDIQADGDWMVRLRDAPVGALRPILAGESGSAPDPERAAAARLAGEAAAGGWSWGWFTRGLVGGALAGPFGAGYVVHRAGSGGIELPPDPAPELVDPQDLTSYRDAYQSRLAARRRSAALAGGLVGTAAFLYALLRWIDVGGEAGGTPPPPGSTPQLTIIVDVRP